MDFMFMPLVTQLMDACLLDHIIILLEKSTVLQKTRFAMLVISETLQLGMMVLPPSLLLTTRFLFLDPTPSLGGLLLSMLILMILEEVDMSLARPQAMLVEDWLVVSLVFKVKAALSNFQTEGWNWRLQFPLHPIQDHCSRKRKKLKRKIKKRMFPK